MYWIWCRIKHRKSKLPMVLFIITVLLMVFFSVIIIIFGPTDPSRYGFESGVEGWAPETSWPDSLGINEVAQSDLARLGKHSLMLTADLEGGHPNRSKGEAFVQIPIQNLENKPITAWVFVPRRAIGDAKRPNGIQVFVKDELWRGEYGTWWDIFEGWVEDWFQVTLTPSGSPPPNGYMAPGFDPTQIRAVGIKVAIGDGSKREYNGPIYVDCVDYPK